MAISLQNAATETIETRKENKKLKMELEILKKQISVSGEKVEAIDNSLESFGLEIQKIHLKTVKIQKNHLKTVRRLCWL